MGGFGVNWFEVFRRLLGGCFVFSFCLGFRWVWRLVILGFGLLLLCGLWILASLGLV